MSVAAVVFSDSGDLVNLFRGALVAAIFPIDRQDLRVRETTQARSAMSEIFPMHRGRAFDHDL